MFPPAIYSRSIRKSDIKDSFIRFPLPFLNRRPLYARREEQIKLRDQKAEKGERHVYR